MHLQALRNVKSSSSVGRYSWRDTFHLEKKKKKQKNNKTTSALHNRINTFTARFPSASYVKQQTFKSFLCSEAACPAGCKHRIHMGSADGYFRSHMKSILSPIKLPTHVRGVQA